MFLLLLPFTLHILSFLYQSFHLTDFPLEEAVHADLTTIGVEGNGGEANDRGVNPNTRDRLVRDELHNIKRGYNRMFE